MLDSIEGFLDENFFVSSWEYIVDVHTIFTATVSQHPFDWVLNNRILVIAQ